MAHHVIVEFNLDKSKVFRDDPRFPENLYLALAHRHVNDERILRNYGIKVLNEHHSSDCKAQAIAALPELVEALEIAIKMLQAANCTAAILNPLEEALAKVEGK